MKYNKTLLILCGVILLTFTIAKYLRDDMKVISLSKQQHEDNDLEIIDGENHIRYVSNLNTIKDIVWINEDIVQFKGKDGESDIFKVFQFNYTDKDFSLNNNYKEDKFYNKDFKEKIEYVKRIDEDNYAIYVEGKGLFHAIKGKKPIFIANNIKLDDKLLLKISDNKKKIAYYDPNEKMIKIYDFINNQSIKIEQDINDEILNDFEDNINFSYEGGYLTVSNINRENFKESYFTVYGADSGKMYVEKLMGINPVWGNNNLFIAFTYIQDNSIANTKKSSIENLVGDRIGFLNLKTRKIKYVQSINKGYKVIKPAIWSKEKEILIVIGKYSKDEKKYNFNSIYSYDINKNTITDLAGYFEETNDIGYDFEVQIYDNYIYISSQNESQENIVKVIDLINRRENDLKNLQEFITNCEYDDRKLLYKEIDSDKFLYVQNNSIYVSDLKSNHLKFKTSGIVTGVYESPNKSRLFIISKFGEKYELAIVNL
ncbi:hypothetical protein [Paramaledivibacter caminithermalis]|jgi:hypothetical protein|uniref:Uncharacterized protein n=1 Tax=Paramaledivibacter caminithermalis (strain DSM 15212 / CIP 107654 / DViRD3) TaxID=1121301 RepID=A0A1M6M632_PARC5|nr:hypothetical protein [Paramaledivibacter caminithermalis]SHJ78925.1 hypothetical protein SAMN02745912_01075 [Paramaledivibacter caminithermalis DSM 15212]